MNLPSACEFRISSLVLTNGALNGSGKALKAKPKLVSIVSARFSLPAVNNGRESSTSNAPDL